MGQKKNEKELLFMQCRDSMQEVVGWKVFIFLPQSNTWRFVMIMAITIQCVYNFTRAIYLEEPAMFSFVNLLGDIIYYVDLVFSMMHFGMKKTRKLRHGKRRHAFCLIIDCISVLPLEALYNNSVYNETKKNKRVGYLLNLVGALRLYQIPRNFSSIKDSVYRVKFYVLITVMQVFTYFLILTHFLSCFIFLYFNENQKNVCLEKFTSCVVENFLQTFYLLGQCYELPFMKYPLVDYTLLLIFDFLIGYIFTYGYVVPLLVFVSTRCLVKCFEYSRDLRHITVVTGNLIKDKKLRKKVLDYYHEVWSFGRCDRTPELLDVFPLCLRKNIFCDMHWDAMRHSYLLKDLSIGCKRSLALCMKTEFLLPDTKVFEKNITPSYFVYLESGFLQIMAEENSNTPVLTLSGGTVLGEIAFYYYKTSQATVRAAKYSIIHTLPSRSLYQVLLDYPIDKEKVLYKVKARMKLAKTMHAVKTNICTHFNIDSEREGESVEETKWGNIKWIKSQYRAIINLRNGERLLGTNEGSKEDIERLILRLDTQIKHTSVNLPYLSVNDEKLNRHGVVCLNKFPWLMDPQCQFVFVWKVIIYIVILFTVIMYPLYIFWFPEVPRWFFAASCVISLIYFVDVLLKFNTAIKIKNFTIHKFSTVFVYRITRLIHIADYAAAFPLQLFTHGMKKPFISNLGFLIALLKCYLLFPLIYKLNYTPRPLAFLRTMIKYIFFLIFLIYLSASIYYVTGVQCAFYNCGHDDWFRHHIIKLGRMDGVYCAVLRAVYVGFEIPDEEIHTGVLESYITFWIFFCVTHSFYFALKGECTAAYVLELSYDVDYKSRMDYVFNFMGQHKLVGQLRKRVMSTMQFQWSYDKKSYITEKAQLWDGLSENLKKKIELECILPVISKSKLFESENEAFLKDLCHKAVHMALPEYSLLLTLNTQTSRLYIVQRGFVQINSFIEGDLHLNISTPITAKEGDTFPVIDVFSQTSSAVTALTVSECELIVFELEDILSVMMAHGIFKDFVEVVKETDLSVLNTAKPGVSEFKGASDNTGEDPYNDFLKRVKGLKRFLNAVLRRNAIDSHSVFYLYWEVIRVIYVFFSLIFWPIVLCCFNGASYQFIITKFLFIIELSSFVDFYIRMHIAYYNKLGIYVSHPISTAVHYVATAFMADLLAYSPNLHLCYWFARKELKLHWSSILCHIILRSLSVYRIIGFLKFMKVYGKVIYRTQFIIVIFFVLLFIHYYICFMVYLYITGQTEPKFRLTENKKQLSLAKPYALYFNEMGIILSLVLRSMRFLNKHDFYTVLFNVIMAALGLSGQIWLFAHLTLNTMTSDKRLTTYQYLMKSFVNYLIRQKADEHIINQAVEHFEYEWQRQEGNDLQKIFLALPETLHEDVCFPLYKMTLSGVASLSRANTYFHRTLSRYFQEMHLKQGTVIIYSQEVQPYIFFLHSGQCAIENSNQILYKGAMIGDIKLRGIMKNTITARTNVELLKISSKLFFRTLSNFHQTKLAYEAEVDRADDFLVSIYIEEQDDQVIFTEEQEQAECEFVADEPEVLVSKKKKKRRFYLNFHSQTAQLLRFFFMLVAYATVIVVPVFISLRLYTVDFLAIVYVLDFLWILKIIITARMINPMDSSKTQSKLRRRLAFSSLIIFNVFTVFPIEIFPLMHYGLQMSDGSCVIICMCYINRLFRMGYIFKFFTTKGRRLLANFFIRALGIIMLKLAVINISSALHLLIHRRGGFDKFECYKVLSYQQKELLLRSYLCVLNDFIGAGMPICLPTDAKEVVFELFMGLWSLLSKVFFINHVLMIIYVTHHNKSNQMVQLEELDKYLTVRYVSPILRSGAQKYFCSLLNSFYEGADTSFLNCAPSSIRTAIMQNIYMSFLANCYIFRGLSEIFLKQLTARLYLNIFFPGDYITQKGDVDHNIYFIKTGEVYCIETDKYFTTMEKATDLYSVGSSFGIEQGIFPCCPHTMTYRAKTLTNILVLNYYKWEDLRIAFPETYQSILRAAQPG